MTEDEFNKKVRGAQMVIEALATWYGVSAGEMDKALLNMIRHNHRMSGISPDMSKGLRYHSEAGT